MSDDPFDLRAAFADMPNVKILNASDMARCPNKQMDVHHYRKDGTCMHMPGQFLITIKRTELIGFLINAESTEDAVARYLADGDETSSRTLSTKIVSIESE